MEFSEKFVNKFWSKVNRRGSDECWEWGASRDMNGYGTTRIRIAGPNKYNYKTLLSHRVSYILSIGPIIDSLCVLHKCDNPPCVNPNHLFLGTRRDNHRDMMLKGRNSFRVVPSSIKRGEDSSSAKLSSSQVVEIRALSEDGLSSRRLGRMFGVSHFTILQIVKRNTWRHM